MNLPEERALRIFVVATSSGRRADLAEMAVRAAPARAATAAGMDHERIANFAAEIVIVDIDGPELARAAVRTAAVRPSDPAVIALVDSPDSRWVAQALSAGVCAILSREVIPEELRLAISAAETGLVLLHPTSAQRIWQQQISPASSPALSEGEALTARERGILRLLSEGMGNKEIAGRLSISEHTVKFHVSSILAKLGASRRTEAVSYGIRNGLIPI